MAINVLTLVGSLRSGSTNLQLAEAAAANAPEGVEVSIYQGLDQLPFFNEDLEGEPGAEVAALREAVAVADALLLVTPEYNGTIPAHLKNAIDWASRPYANGVIKGKKVAAIGTAAGQGGAADAQAEVRKAGLYAGATVVEDIALSIPGSVQRFASTHPKDDAEVVTQISEVLDTLKGAVEQELVAQN